MNGQKVKIIAVLELEIANERARILARLGSPLYVRENYERLLQLGGIERALNIVMSVDDAALDSAGDTTKGRV